MTNTHPLAGNPYAEHHQHRPGVTEDNEQWAIAQATLALVFEQRTANETLNRIADALERLHV